MNEFQPNTGVQPVPTGTPVDVIFRNGEVAINVPAGVVTDPAVSMNFAADWSLEKVDWDIVQWRLSTPTE